VPAYFFVGGAAGVAGALAGVASLAGADAALVRDARWVALAGAVVSPALLISDLGRPERFLNMLRVFKPQSAMSVGVWTLVIFSVAIAASIGTSWLGGSRLVGALAVALDIVVVVTGLVLATYTGVLIGATSIPEWSAHVRVLPALFGASSLGAGVALVELVGHTTAALQWMGLAAAAAETMIAVLLWRRVAGRGAALIHAGDALAGPLALALRLAVPVVPGARLAAGLSAIAGSIALRYGWMERGRG
jgi:formate-dependent nitrite reductase membrane component NrfD